VSGNIATNNAVVNFSPTSTQTITHFVLGTGSTINGSHTYYDALSASIGVDNGDELKFTVGNLDVEINGLFSNYMAEDCLEEFVQGQTRVRPSPHYWALSTTTPSADGSNFTEPSSGGYGRTTISNPGNVFPTSPTMGDPTTYTTNANIPFASPTGSWGTVTYWGIFDASSGGNLLFFGQLDSSANVQSGDTVRFLSGDLTVTME
jgi:hypothetical protein